MTIVCELIVIYLGGRVTRKMKDGTLKHPTFKMRYPGAFHQARFLAKSLYLIKISMMMDILPEDIVPIDKRDSVDRTVLLIVMFWNTWTRKVLLIGVSPSSCSSSPVLC